MPRPIRTVKVASKDQLISKVAKEQTIVNENKQPIVNGDVSEKWRKAGVKWQKKPGRKATGGAVKKDRVAVYFVPDTYQYVLDKASELEITTAQYLTKLVEKDMKGGK